MTDATFSRELLLSIINRFIRMKPATSISERMRHDEVIQVDFRDPIVQARKVKGFRILS